MSTKKFLWNKHSWSMVLMATILILLLASLTPGVALALTPTPSKTPTRTPTITPSPTFCPPPTQEPLWVEPVTSPTTQLSQVVTVRIGNGDAVTVTAESGVFVVTGTFSVNTPALVTVSLLPNTTHNLSVAAHVKKMGCYNGYTLSTTRDRNGAPLTIVQQSTGLPDLVVNSIQAGVTWTNNCTGGVFRPYTNVGIQNTGPADAGAFQVALMNPTSNISQTVSGLLAGQFLTVSFVMNGYPLTATVDSTNTVIESNENNNTRSNIPGPGTPSPTPTRTGTPPPPFPTCTPTPTPGTPSPTPTWTNTPGTPTFTPTRTPTPTWTNTPVPGGDLCATPTVITGGGSYSVSTSGVCFKYVNAAFSRGAMWSVMNGSDSTVSNVVKWYGGRNESVTNCINDSQTLNGNGAQINNFTVGKDSTNAMYVTITANKVNTVSMSIQNWQNGTGCSVAPTPHP